MRTISIGFRWLAGGLLLSLAAARVASAGDPICGNGTIETGEACDDGELNGTTECGCQIGCEFTPVTTFCGDPTDTTCDLADSCDGAGTCLVNHQPAETPCEDDFVFCNGVEVCNDIGVCTSPGDPCGLGELCFEETEVCAGSPFLINELDSDTPGTDALEFVELYDGGAGDTPLDGHVLVFYNGNGDVSYAAFDLDGFSTDENGYFVAGNTAVAGVDLVFTGNLLQNGQDAVALYVGDATSFPNGTAVTTSTLVDAIVYDTSDADDPGLLVLLNAAQPQVNEDGGGTGAADSSQRCPDGSGGARNTETYLVATPTPGVANGCPAPPVEAYIHEVQGAGATSPLAGASVRIEGIVTGVRSNGFFVQEEDDHADADPLTSEGILVFTGGPPPAAAAVGNLVDVAGTVTEFAPSQDALQPPLTEITAPTVTLVGTGQPLPAPIALTGSFPDPAGAHDQLERYEGMRVSVATLVVSGPTLGNTNETDATSTTTGVFHGTIPPNPRPFREAGIQAPDPAPSGTIPPIPRFDSNPERIRVDSDSLVGASAIDVGAGATVSTIVGPLDYAFRTYSISPDPGSAVPSGAPLPAAVATPTNAEFTVAAYNLERFFDTVDEPSTGEPVLTVTAFDNRLAKASLQIRDYLETPDILGVVEVENLATLSALAAKINADAVAAAQPNPDYEAYLVEGNDVGGIDVGFLVKTAAFPGGTPRVEVIDVVQELDGTQWLDPSDNTLHTLNDRPPLRLDAVVHHGSGEQFALTVIVVHQRSLNGVSSIAASGATTEGNRVRAKRRAQAEDLANLIQARQSGDPAERIVVLGDFNAFEFNDGLVDVMGTVRGVPAPAAEVVLASSDLVNPDLVRLSDASNYSFVFDGNAQNLDHALVNAPLVATTSARRLEHARINADFAEIERNDYSAGNPKRLADHDPLVVYFAVDSFATTLFKDDFETGDSDRWSLTFP